MSVTVQWDNERHTVLRYDFQGRWTWDEFFQAFEEAKVLMDTVGHTVYFINNPLDEVSRNYIPPGALTHIVNIYRRPAPNAGTTVNVGNEKSFARSLMDVISRIAPAINKRFAYADTLEEARAILETRIATKAN